MSRFETDEIYIVAEMGQNHNGDMDIAKALIDDAYAAGCSAVKSAKRDLSHELSDKAYARLYDNPNSFGKTYGEHRKFLEFSPEQHRILKKYTNNRKMDYFLSVCDIPSLEFALELNPPLIKIPSKEITNIPLLEKAAECGKIVAFSLGLATEDEIQKAARILDRYNLFNNIPIVCTSQYPCEYDNIHLRRLDGIKIGRKGFSSHTPDPMLGIVAMAMGATYIEYHITLDREMKGTDQPCSLEVDEFAELVDGIATLQIAMGDQEFITEIPYYLKPAREKLQKHKCDDGVYRI